MQTFNIDIAQSPAPLVLYAKQGDSLSRFFQINFLESGQPWTPPAGALFAVRYGSLGMPSGWYDTITEPDGSSHSAFGLLGSVLTVEIAHEAVSVSGRNSLCVLVLDANGYQLGAWNLALQVEITPGENAPESTQYYSLLSAQVAQVLAATEDARGYATEARSWAEGGTGSRAGEDTDNAEYWAGQSKIEAQKALGFRTISSAVVPEAGTGDVDPTSPMLMANLTATSAADRLDHVVVPGKTIQEGSGDPSPVNVRALSGVGKQRVEQTFSSSAGWNLASTIPNFFYTSAVSSIIQPPQSNATIADIVSSYYKPASRSAITSSPQSICVQIDGQIGVYDPTVDTVQALGEKFSANPLTVWFIPKNTSDATGWYTYAAVSGDTYAAVGPELDGPLFDGDSINNNAETPSGRQCAVYRQKVLYTLTGQENYQTFDIWSPGAVVIYGYLVGAVRVSGYDTVANIQCSHLVTKSSNSITTNGDQGCGQANGTALFLSFGSPYNSLESAKAYIQQQYAAGTPVQILATLAAPTTTYSDAQPLKNPAGTWTLSGENTPVGYMRPLTDADRADNADQLGGLTAEQLVPHYQTAETAMPYTWVDGKTVYRQCLELAVSDFDQSTTEQFYPDYAGTITETSTTQLNSKTVVLNGAALILPTSCATSLSSDGQNIRPISNTRPGGQGYELGWRFDKSGTGWKISVDIGRFRSNQFSKFLFVIYYTK